MHVETLNRTIKVLTNGLPQAVLSINSNIFEYIQSDFPGEQSKRASDEEERRNIIVNQTLKTLGLHFNFSS